MSEDPPIINPTVPQIYITSDALPMHLLWNKTGEQGNKWIKGTVNIGGHANFRIVFEGVRGNGYQGDIAIDDISFEGCKPGEFWIGFDLLEIRSVSLYFWF